MIGDQFVVRPVPGSTPSDRFEINRDFALLDALNDSGVDDLSNSSPTLGPADIEHAFQWDFTSVAGNGDTRSIDVQSSVLANIVALPDGNDDGTFTFNVGNPNMPGNGPVWYDPDNAAGYDYTITEGANTNSFAELFLPVGIGDGQNTITVDGVAFSITSTPASPTRATDASTSPARSSAPARTTNCRSTRTGC